MIVLARRGAWMLGLAAAGCFPVPDPPWLVGDKAELLALRIEVVEEGALSTIVAPVPVDRRRTDALPGDTIGFRPWVIDRARVWPHEELDVAYFACLGSSCVQALRSPSGTIACADLLRFEQRPCALGRGPDARFTLPTGGIEITAIDYISIFAIAGEPGVIDTDACIDALRDSPRGRVDQCMMYERRVGVGPQWALQLLLQDILDDNDNNDDDGTGGGDDDTSGGQDDTTGGDDPFAPPPEVFFEWPNFNPEVERFSLVIERRGEVRPFDHRSGDRIAVRPGDDVRVTHERDPRDAQSYVTDVQTLDGTSIRYPEVLNEQWYATHPLSPFTDVPGVQTVRFEVPRDVAAFRVDVRLTDRNHGYGWGSLYFEVDGATP